MNYAVIQLQQEPIMDYALLSIYTFVNHYFLLLREIRSDTLQHEYV